jgi:hypothetical protein
MKIRLVVWQEYEDIYFLQKHKAKPVRGEKEKCNKV